MVRNFLYSYVFLALCASIITFSVGFGGEYSEMAGWYILLVFFATLLEYNVHRFIKIYRDTNEAFQNDWSRSHQTFIKVAVVISVVAIAVILFFLPRSILLWLVVASFPAFFYSISEYQINKNPEKLRRFPGSKNLIVVFTWVVVTFIIPLQIMGIDKLDSILMWKLFALIMFILTLTIPFDIRDFIHDGKTYVKSIPVWIGKEKAKQFLMISFAMMCVLQIPVFMEVSIYKIAGIVVFCFLFGLFLFNRKIKKSTYYYALILDGSLLLYALAYLM